MSYKITAWLKLIAYNGNNPELQKVPSVIPTKLASPTISRLPRLPALHLFLLCIFP